MNEGRFKGHTSPLVFVQLAIIASLVPHDIDDSVCAKLLKFADDTKVFSVVSTKNEFDRLQIDLINLGKWSHEATVV